MAYGFLERLKDELGIRFSDSLEERLYHSARISADKIRKNYERKTGEEFTVPSVFVQAGSGLSEILKTREGYRIEELCRIGFDEIGFPKLGAAGHQGELVFTKVSRENESDSKTVVFARGRKHLYEYEEGQIDEGLVNVCLAVVTMALLNDSQGKQGIDNYILTNAAGSLYSSRYPVRSVMGIKDQLNVTGKTILRGEIGGPLFDFFTPQSGDYMLYSKKLTELAGKIAEENNIPFSTGVYSVVNNTSRLYETPAQCEMARKIGADTVGASTIFEAEALNGIKFKQGRNIQVLGLSLITNASASEKEETQLTSDHVTDIGNDSVCQERMSKLILETILRM